MWDILLVLACFVSGFLTRGFYDSVRERYFAKKLIKKWGRMKEN